MGLDQHPAGHDRGASHGESRIVRKVYFEGAAHVPLLLRSYELWDRPPLPGGDPARGDGGAVRGADAGALVLAPGRWAPALLAEMGLPLRVERRVMRWFAPSAGVGAFAPERFPVWIWEREDGTAAYGVPAMGGPTGGVKAAVHRSVVQAPDAWSAAGLLAPLLPGLGDRLLRSVECTYTLTPDEHFVIGRHPVHDRVVVACGFSGHGFKFTPVVGEALAGSAVGAVAGATAHDLALFDPGRFAR